MQGCLEPHRLMRPIRLIRLLYQRLLPRLLAFAHMSLLANIQGLSSRGSHGMYGLVVFNVVVNTSS